MLQKSDFDAFLKEYWTSGKMEVLTYQYRPLLAMMPKNTEIGGEYWVVPIDLDDGADGSPTFEDAQSVAQTTGTDAQRKQFKIEVVEDFQLAQISNKLIRLSRKTPGLALQRAAEETKKKKNILARRIARNMYRSGYGEIGQVDTAISATSTKIIGLKNKQDARNFNIGQRVVFAATLTGALRDSGDYVTVTKVDYDAAKITTDAPTSLDVSITAIATADYIFLKGARGVAATPTQITMKGLASRIPITAPTGGESYDGLDRSVWPDRLAGLRYNGGTAATGSVKEILIDSLIDAAIREAYCTHVFMDPKKYGDAIMSLEGTVERIRDEKGVGSNGKPTTKVGFAGFEVQVGYGNGGTKVFPDANQQVNFHHALTLDTWELGSAGELIQNDLQSGSSRDVENASRVEYRYVFTGEMACMAPGKNQVVEYAA